MAGSACHGAYRVVCAVFGNVLVKRNQTSKPTLSIPSHYISSAAHTTPCSKPWWGHVQTCWWLHTMQHAFTLPTPGDATGHHFHALLTLHKVVLKPSTNGQCSTFGPGYQALA